MLQRILLSFFVAVQLASTSFGAFAQVTSADYQRADSILKLNDLVYHQINSVNWIDQTSNFWYQVKTREGVAYYLVDAAKSTRTTLFDTEKLVLQLNKQPGIKTTPKLVHLQKLKFAYNYLQQLHAILQYFLE